MFKHKSEAENQSDVWQAATSAWCARSVGILRAAGQPAGIVDPDDCIIKASDEPSSCCLNFHLQLWLFGKLDKQSMEGLMEVKTGCQAV